MLLRMENLPSKICNNIFRYFKFFVSITPAFSPHASHFSKKIPSLFRVGCKEGDAVRSARLEGAKLPHPNTKV